jgi:hypothetical protein
MLGDAFKFLPHPRASPTHTASLGTCGPAHRPADPRPDQCAERPARARSVRDPRARIGEEGARSDDRPHPSPRSDPRIAATR